MPKIAPLHSDSARLEHIPLLQLFVELVQPQVYVELGIDSGASYLAVCQTVAALSLSCRCYGVARIADYSVRAATSRDSAPALGAEHDARYGGFSRLLRARSDDALSGLPDAMPDAMPDMTIDLLHIDGARSYQDLAQDFAAWTPKLSRRGVVLLSGIAAPPSAYGARRLWSELSARHRHFSSPQAGGLGLLLIGSEAPVDVQALLSLDPTSAARVADLYFRLGQGLRAQADLARQQQQTQSLVDKLQSAHRGTHEAQVGLDDLRRQLALAKSTQEQQQQREAALLDRVRQLEDTLQTLNSCLSFRIGLLATAPLRWVAGKWSG